MGCSPRADACSLPHAAMAAAPPSRPCSARSHQVCSAAATRLARRPDPAPCCGGGAAAAARPRRCSARLGSARPAAGAAPDWGDLALLPALPRAPPSGPSEKLQLVEIFVLGVWVFYFYFLLFLNHRSSQKHDLRLLLFHQI